MAPRGMAQPHVRLGAKPPVAQGRSNDAHRNQMIQNHARQSFYASWERKHGTLRGAPEAFQVKLDEIARERDPNRAYRMVQALTQQPSSSPRLPSVGAHRAYNRPPAGTGRATAVAKRAPAAEASLGDSLKRGAKGLGLALDLGAYGLEQGVRRVVGDEAVNKLNTSLGYSPNVTADILAESVRQYNAMPQNQTLARASKRFDEAGGFFPGVVAWGQTIGEDPMSIAHLAAEQVPGLVLGAGAGKVVSAAAVPVATRVAPMAAVPVARGMVFGSTMAGTQTALGAGSNVAAANAAEGGGRLTPGQIGLGVRQTAGEMPAAMLTGGLTGVSPFKGVTMPGKFGAAAGNTAAQSTIQGLGGVGSRIGGDLATGQRSTGGELFTAGAMQAPFAPFDLAAKTVLVGPGKAPSLSEFISQTRGHLDAAKATEVSRPSHPGPPRLSDRAADARRFMERSGAQIGEFTRAAAFASALNAFDSSAPFTWRGRDAAPYVQQGWMVGEGAPRRSGSSGNGFPERVTTLIEPVEFPDHVTGIGYGVNNPPVRIKGPWSNRDIYRGLLGLTPEGLGSPDLHHAHQMPGSGIHEIWPSYHRGNVALHPNKFNQGVTKTMRNEDAELHWWYRAQEEGAWNIYPDDIYR